MSKGCLCFAQGTVEKKNAYGTDNLRKDKETFLAPQELVTSPNKLSIWSEKCYLFPSITYEQKYSTRWLLL